MSEIQNTQTKTEQNTDIIVKRLTKIVQERFEDGSLKGSKQKYVLEISGEKYWWPDRPDRIYIKTCWIARWGGYICTERTFNIGRGVDINISYVHENVDGTGGWSVEFVLPEYENEELTEPWVELAYAIEEGEITEDNLPEAIKNFLSNMKEYIAMLAEVYLEHL